MTKQLDMSFEPEKQARKAERVRPACRIPATLPLVCPVCGTEAVAEFEGEPCGVCGATFQRRATQP